MKTVINYDLLYFKKTSKFIVFGVLGIFLAGFSALTAKYFNVIIEYSLGQEGIDIVLPEPTVLESYTQFFSNFTQIYLFVILFIAVTFFIQDKTRGHYPLIFTKPILRSHYILSKSLVISLTLIVSYIVSALFFGYYSFVLFNEFDVGLYMIASLAFLVFCLVMIHAGLFFSVIFRSFLGAILLPIILFVLFGLMGPLDGGIFKYFPYQLMRYPLVLMAGEVETVTVLLTTIIGFLITLALLLGSIKLFQSKSLL